MRYGIETVQGATRLVIESELDFLREVGVENRDFPAHLRIAQELHTLIRSDERLIFDFSAMWRERTEEKKRLALRCAYMAFAAIANAASYHRDAADQCIRLHMSTRPIDAASARYFMRADVTLPDQPPQKLSQFASVHMRSIATQLRYPSKNYRFLSEDVYADIDPARGLTFQTNQIGSCSLDTDGDSYRPGDNPIELTMHNIYAPEQQLILATGVIAAVCGPDKN